MERAGPVTPPSLSSFRNLGLRERAGALRGLLASRGDITFCNGPPRLVGSDRKRADKVEVLFRASKADKKRAGATITRTRARSNNTHQWGGNNLGAVEILLDISDLHSDLGERAPLMQANCGGGVAGHLTFRGHACSESIIGQSGERSTAIRSALRNHRRSHALGAVRGNGNTDPARRTLEINSVYGLCQSSGGGRRGVHVQGAHSERQTGRRLN